MSINYTKNGKGKYQVELNGKEYHVQQLMSGNWSIFTLDREVREFVRTKGEATVWLYKNILKSL